MFLRGAGGGGGGGGGGVRACSLGQHGMTATSEV